MISVRQTEAKVDNTFWKEVWSSKWNSEKWWRR